MTLEMIAEGADDIGAPLISPLTRSIGFLECNFVWCRTGKLL